VALYAISDLHLSLSSEKPMDVFGAQWKDHHIKIKDNWNSKINEDDVVLVAGDISWAIKLDEAMEDLSFVQKLNGKKIFIKGNHDYWWGSITKLNSLYSDMIFLQNTYYDYGEYGICGTRGWVSIDNTEEHDEKVYNRELLRLKMSLESAKKGGKDKFIVMMHYPPVTKISKSQEFLDLLAEYQIEKLIYGHIHQSAKIICINGLFNGIEYICTSADIINFDPVRIL
jgi:uncharacterized protein